MTNENDKHNEEWVNWKSHENAEHFVYRNADKLIPAFLKRSKEVGINLWNLITFWKK